MKISSVFYKIQQTKNTTIPLHKNYNTWYGIVQILTGDDMVGLGGDCIP
jgi:hypothetical protein